MHWGIEVEGKAVLSQGPGTPVHVLFNFGFDKLERSALAETFEYECLVAMLTRLEGDYSHNNFTIVRAMIQSRAGR